MGAAGGRGRGLIALKQTAQLPLAAPRKQPPKIVLITGGSGAKETQQNYQKFFGPQLGTSSSSYFEQGLNSKAIAHLKETGALQAS
jgi:hypothetical protein